MTELQDCYEEITTASQLNHCRTSLAEIRSEQWNREHNPQLGHRATGWTGKVESDAELKAREAQQLQILHWLEEKLKAETGAPIPPVRFRAAR